MRPSPRQEKQGSPLDFSGCCLSLDLRAIVPSVPAIAALMPPAAASVKPGKPRSGHFGHFSLERRRASGRLLEGDARGNAHGARCVAGAGTAPRPGGSGTTTATGGPNELVASAAVHGVIRG